MPNPLVSGGSSPNSATNPSAAVTLAQPTTLRQKTNFPMAQQMLDTHLYGLVTPHFVFDCVPNDDVRLNISTRLHSYTLAAPLLSPLRSHRAYMAVPMQAILYNTWSKIFVDPKKGDDVDFNKVNCMLNPHDLLTNVWSVITAASTSGTSAVPADFQGCNILIGAVALTSALVDADSLFDRLGISAYVNTGYAGSFFTKYRPDYRGDFITRLYSSFSTYFSSERTSSDDDEKEITNWRVVVNVLESSGSTPADSLSFQSFDLSAMREIFRYWSEHIGDNVTFSFAFGDSVFFSPDESTVYGIVFRAVLAQRSFFNFTNSNVLLDYPINVSRIVAYQLACAQFLTNDDVDYIYTSELYRQNQESLVILSGLALGSLSFVWNGIRIYYDWCSGSIFTSMRQFIGNSNPDASVYALSFFLNFLLPQRSLRYGDYFNSARTQPLAVGDITAPVTSSSVSAIDVTTSILSQKYLNLVNSVRNTIRGYSLAVYGVAPDILPPEPRFISHTSFQINDNVVVNTAENQGNQESNLTGQSRSFEFQSHFNQNTIIIGVTWYDCMPCYIGARDRFAFISDRMDMYIPQLQNIGDRPIYKAELGSTVYNENIDDAANVFGYQSNNIEYKIMVSRACAGFATGSGSGTEAPRTSYLPSWGFTRSLVNPTLSSEFIRSHPYEIDEFYKSLTNTGVGYFHFIVSNYMEVNASRPMQFVSGILMNS